MNATLSTRKHSCALLAVVTILGCIHVWQLAYDDTGHTLRAQGGVEINNTQRSHQHIANDIDARSKLPRSFTTINTFFQPLERQNKIRVGVIETKHRAVLDAWAAAWTSEGWATRVLTLDDAKKHPRYSELEARISKLPLGKSVQYDKMCYLRCARPDLARPHSLPDDAHTLATNGM